VSQARELQQIVLEILNGRPEHVRFRAGQLDVARTSAERPTEYDASEPPTDLVQNDYVWYARLHPTVRAT
jgi:hypothetical protein